MKTIIDEQRKSEIRARIVGLTFVHPLFTLWSEEAIDHQTHSLSHAKTHTQIFRFIGDLLACFNSCWFFDVRFSNRELTSRRLLFSSSSSSGLGRFFPTWWLRFIPFAGCRTGRFRRLEENPVSQSTLTTPASREKTTYRFARGSRLDFFLQIEYSTLD